MPAEAKTAENKVKKEQVKDTLGTLMPLDTFIVNLKEESGKRYLKVTLELELSDKKVEEETRKRMPLIRDNILVLLSSKSFEDVNTVKGKYRLKDEIVARLGSLLGNGKIKQAYFTEFVVQ